MEWPNMPEHRSRPKPIEWNGQQIPKGMPELVMEPEKLAKLIEQRENGQRLRIFEVREGHRREKERWGNLFKFIQNSQRIKNKIMKLQQTGG
jgi:hypothetical protein